MVVELFMQRETVMVACKYLYALGKSRTSYI